MPLRLIRRGKIYYLRGTVAGQSVYESTGAADRSLAETVLEKRQAELWHRHLHGERATATFAEAALIYLEGRDIGPLYRASIRKIVKHFGQMELARITQREVDRYIARHHARSAPATIIRAVITPMTAIMRAAATRGLCDPPAFARPKPPPGRLRYLTEAEAQALVDAAAPHLQPLLIFLLHTGARLGEALNLDWRDVDLHARRVVFTMTKNGEARGVPLNEAALLALANLPHRTGPVFRTPKGRAYYDHRERGGSPIKTGFRSACIRAGLLMADPKNRRNKNGRILMVPSVRVHDLRHTFASWLAMRGVPLRTIAELMGHRTLKMVMRYAHLSPDHLRGAVDVLTDVQNPCTKEKAAGQSIEK